METPTSKNKLSDNAYLKYASMASQMIFVIVLGVVLGKFLDKKFDTGVIFTAICSLLFVSASIYLVLKDFIKK